MSPLFAFLHHLSAFTLVAALAVEFALVRDDLTLGSARKVLIADAVYGASAAILIVVGFLRVFYFEKGATYYFHTWTFIAKLTLFVVIGLVQALARLDLPSLSLGSSKNAEIGERVVVGGAGGRQRAVAARIIAKQEFAGYWEYVLDEAIFTAPAHPNWGGTAVIGPAGDLIGVGSLQIQQAAAERRLEDVNMVVPIDLLKPILDDLMSIGRANRPARPWLGIYATEVGSNVAILGLASRGPAQRADLRAGDIVLSVAGSTVSDLAGLFRRVWALGQAGVEVPLLINREGKTFELRVRSSDRRRFLKGPVLH